MGKDTMRAVIFKGPHKIAVEDRPVPTIKDQTDIIVKVIYSALCGRYGPISDCARLFWFHCELRDADGLRFC